MRSIDIGLKILELMAVDARIRGVPVVVRRLDRRHAAPRGQRRRRDVGPRAAVVGRHVNEPVIRSDPYHRHEQRRWRYGVDDTAPPSDRVEVRGCRRIERRRRGRIRPSKIRADLRPARRVVGALEQILIGIV